MEPPFARSLRTNLLCAVPIGSAASFLSSFGCEGGQAPSAHGKFFLDRLGQGERWSEGARPRLCPRAHQTVFVSCCRRCCSRSFKTRLNLAASSLSFSESVSVLICATSSQSAFSLSDISRLQFSRAIAIAYRWERDWAEHNCSTNPVKRNGAPSTVCR